MELRDKCDQVVKECLTKIVQTVLQARISFSSNERKKPNKWFNTELEEIERISDELTPWRANIFQPLFLDVYFQPSRPTPPNYTPLMERWKLTYNLTSVESRDIELPTMYKHLVLLVRSLYGTLRLLPAYNVFRNCKRNKTAANSVLFRFSVEENKSLFFTSPPSEYKFGRVNSPFGVLSLAAYYKDDCSFESQSTESLLSAQLIIKDYQPSEQPQQRQEQQYQPSQSKGIDIPSSQHTDEALYEAARSAPIGIPGKGRGVEDFMTAVPSPPSSTRYGTSPFQNPPSLPKYSTSVPSNQPMHAFAPLSTSPFSTAQPFTAGGAYGVSAGSGNSSSSNNSSSSSSGSLPFNYVTTSANTYTTPPGGSGYSTTPSGNTIISPPSNNTTTPSNYSTSYTHNNPPFNAPPHTGRPRSTSYTPLSTTPPFSAPPPGGGSNPSAPVVVRSNSISSKSPPFRLSISPFKEPPFGVPADSHSLATQPPPKPKPNMKVSTLLGPSMIIETADNLLNNSNSNSSSKDSKGSSALVSSNSNSSGLNFANAPFSSSLSLAADEPAFATGGSVGADSEIGEFIRMCQSAPPLKLFSMVESRSTVSRLFSDNFAELSKIETMDLNAS